MATNAGIALTASEYFPVLAETARPTLRPAASNPSTKAFAPRRFTKISAANFSADNWRNSSSKVSVSVCSMPARLKSSSRCSRLVSVRGSRPSSSFLGWPANVTTVERAPLFRARARFAARIA